MSQIRVTKFKYKFLKRQSISTIAVRESQLTKVLHITTAHRADDVRIYHREIRSILESHKYMVYYAASGGLNFEKNKVNFRFIKIPISRTNRICRLIFGNVALILLAFAIKPRIVHIHDLELLPSSILIAKFSGIRVVWDSHENYFVEFEELKTGKETIHASIRKLIKKVVFACLRKIDLLGSGICCATSEIARNYTDAVIVGNEAIVSEFCAVKPKPDSLNVLFAGSISESACFPEVVRAVKNIPGLTLMTAGDDRQIELLDYAKHELGERFRFLGWLDRDGLKQAISNSSIGFVTYKNYRAYRGGAPTKLHEFAASGLPIVGTPIPAVKDLMFDGNFGKVAKGFSSYEIQQATEEILANTNLWNEFSLNGRNWSQIHGSWVRSSENLMKLYERLSTVNHFES